MDVPSAELIEGESREQRPTTLYRPRPDGELDPAGEAGWYLQREREKRGESAAAAGEAAGIHPYHLEAIEAGFADFPLQEAVINELDRAPGQAVEGRYVTHRHHLA